MKGLEWVRGIFSEDFDFSKEPGDTGQGAYWVSNCKRYYLYLRKTEEEEEDVFLTVGFRKEELMAFATVYAAYIKKGKAQKQIGQIMYEIRSNRVLWR
jgi:hypothetical protein